VLCQAVIVVSATGSAAEDVVNRFAALRQHQRNGQRSPHKPLLVLLALGRLSQTGSSSLPWSAAEPVLAELIAEFGPPSRTGRAQSAAYPFTRLRADGVWVLDQDVQMDLVGPLANRHVTGRFERSVEGALLADPALALSVARALVMSNFPETVAPDVLDAVGLDPRLVLDSPDGVRGARAQAGRRRDAGWRSAVLQAWDRQCAFCGYDGQLAGASVGIDAAHIRWFAFDGPDALDNGLALCALHHKLFDLGVLGLDAGLRVQVSAAFTARTAAGRALYDLDGRPLTPRPGTSAPAAAHVTWHRRQVFKGRPLRANPPTAVSNMKGSR
jgi:putative restriction endonuclease